jgi:hypothetical protein
MKPDYFKRGGISVFRIQKYMAAIDNEANRYMR